MKIKLILIPLIISCLLIPARAAGDEFLHVTDTPLLAEFEQLKPELAADINRSLLGRDLPSISEEDIHLEELFPYYMDARFFSAQIESAGDFSDLIESQEYYLWMLPLRVENYHILVAIGRHHPVRKEARAVLTEEQVEELEEKAGKWGYMWAQYSDGAENNWKAIAQAQSPDADQIVLVNGLAATNSVMAVCIKDGALTDVISLADVSFQIQEADVSEINSAARIASADGSIELRTGDVFSYKEVQQTLGRLVPDESLFPGSGGAFCLEKTLTFPHTLLWIMPIAAIAVLLFMFQFKRRSRT